MHNLLGVVAIAVDNRERSVPAVQEILTKYGESIIGRMGVPHRPAGLHVISVVMQGEPDSLTRLHNELAELKGVQVTSARFTS